MVHFIYRKSSPTLVVEADRFHFPGPCGATDCAVKTDKAAY